MTPANAARMVGVVNTAGWNVLPNRIGYWWRGALLTQQHIEWHHLAAPLVEYARERWLMDCDITDGIAEWQLWRPLEDLPRGSAQDPNPWSALADAIEEAQR